MPVRLAVVHLTADVPSGIVGKCGAVPPTAGTTGTVKAGGGGHGPSTAAAVPASPLATSQHPRTGPVPSPDARLPGTNPWCWDGPATTSRQKCPEIFTVASRICRLAGAVINLMEESGIFPAP